MKRKAHNLSSSSNSPLVDPRTGRLRPQRQQPGYYPGYSTLSQKAFWDAATRELVESRVAKTPPIRFFTEAELPTITAVCDRVLPQDDRIIERRIPIVPVIDNRLHSNHIHGYRYEDMPSDQDAYRWGIEAFEETAQTIHSREFAALAPLEQDYLLKAVHDEKVLAAKHIWDRMSIQRFWELLVGDCAAAYYAHPWAWDEIGYGGPAYPRAYMRLEGGMPEPWEKDEQRYEWSAPPDSISDKFEDHSGADGQSHHGQGGTH